MDIKDDKVLSQNEFIALLAELFSRGQALDMVDVSNEREHGNITDGQKFVYDTADTALDIIDLDKNIQKKLRASIEKEGIVIYEKI